MRTVLFDIPNHLGSLPGPLFGWGWLLLVWAVLCAGVVLWNVRRIGGVADLPSLLPIMLLSGAAIAFLAPSMLDDQRMIGLWEHLDDSATGDPDLRITEERRKLTPVGRHEFIRLIIPRSGDLKFEE